jgi:hypothetical protein
MPPNSIYPPRADCILRQNYVDTLQILPKNTKKPPSYGRFVVMNTAITANLVGGMSVVKVVDHGIHCQYFTS